MKTRWLFIVMCVSISCYPAMVSSQVTFTDVTASAGTGLGDGTARGVAWIDFNNDGLPDLFVPTAGSSPNKLYMNNGNGTFTDVASAVGLDDGGNTYCGSSADFDNDGDVDLLTVGSTATRLWRNNRETGTDTTFTSIETTAGISMSGAQMPAWADYNGDGFADFYSSISNSAASTDALYRNNGDGTFTNVADSAGVNHQVSGVLEQAIHWGDFDKDGYPDLFIGNLSTSGNSFFHHNNGDGTFSEMATTLGFQTAGRGAQWIDYNNDGLWDFSYAPYLGGTATTPVRLFRNNGNGTFTNVSASAGITDNVISWGVTWADYDNNGYEDLFVNVSGSSTNCLLYMNNGDGTFTNATSQAGLGSLVELTAAWGDYDADGFMDLYVGGAASSGNHLFKNNGDPTKHWLEISLEGTRSNRSGVGAQIEVVAGSLHMMREINTATAWRNQNMMPAHFGLATTTSVDSVTVHWPSGTVQTLTGIPADQHMTIVEDTVQAAPSIATSPDTLTLVYTNFFTDTVVVRNAGAADLEVDTIVCLNSMVNVYLRVHPASFIVSPGDSMLVQIILDQPVGGTPLYDFLDSVLVYSNDPVSPVVSVLMQGDFPVEVRPEHTPLTFALEQNYPNPFNPSTSFTFQVASATLVNLRVYDLLGREVATLIREPKQPGIYRVSWNAADMASGVYMYKIEAGGFVASRKLIVLK